MAFLALLSFSIASHALVPREASRTESGISDTVKVEVVVDMEITGVKEQPLRSFFLALWGALEKAWAWFMARITPKPSPLAGIFTAGCLVCMVCGLVHGFLAGRKVAAKS